MTDQGGWEWELTNDGVQPYCWLITYGRIPMIRFIREEEARAYFDRKVTEGPPRAFRKAPTSQESSSG